MAETAYHVRVAGAADEAAVASVLESAFTRLVGLHPQDLFDSGGAGQRWIQPEVLTSGRYYVAERDGVIAACGGWSLEVPGSGERYPNTGYMRDFATDPGHLRCGAASAIMARAFDDARAEGITEMRCVAPIGAAAFYAANGFVQEKQTRIQLPSGVPSMMAVLSCRLDLADA